MVNLSPVKACFSLCDRGVAPILFSSKREDRSLRIRKNKPKEMSRNLPPLKAVRAFEAAARHSSFVLAADELAVTPSAISQQVKLLEQWLGKALFRRNARGLDLTRDGQGLLPALTDSLDTIEQAMLSLKKREERRMLSVTCLSSLASLWLTPRLHRFHAQLAGVDVSLVTVERLVDLAKEDVDLAIRHTQRPYSDFHVETLMTERLGVVCSPELLNHTTHPIRSLQDLKHHTLLHDSATIADDFLTWSAFLAQMKLQGEDAPDMDVDHGLFFSDNHLIVQACLSGRGVMIGRSVLVGDALEAGTLVAPFGMSLKARAQYKLVMLPTALEDQKVLAFRNWIHEEAGNVPPSLP